jgi:hypothetical protein
MGRTQWVRRTRRLPLPAPLGIEFYIEGGAYDSSNGEAGTNTSEGDSKVTPAKPIPTPAEYVPISSFLPLLLPLFPRFPYTPCPPFPRLHSSFFILHSSFPSLFSPHFTHLLSSIHAPTDAYLPPQYTIPNSDTALTTAPTRSRIPASITMNTGAQ